MENLVDLVVVILDSRESNITNEVFKRVAHSGCFVVDARVNTTELHVTLTLVLRGSWSAIVKFETIIKKHQSVFVSRTALRIAQPHVFPYSSYIIAPDREDVLLKLTQFLFEQEVTLYNLHVESYKAPITEAKMLAISLTFGFSADHLVSDFREHFIVFCDENNFDVAMEPHKN